MAETLSTTVIIAIVLGCALVIIIFAFILVTIFYRSKLKKFLRRNNMGAVYKPSIEDPDQSISNFETNSTEINRYAFVKACAKKHEANNLLFNEEFQSLPDYTLINSSSVSKHKINRLKNRYSNIEAFNHSRVILNDKSSSGDYINANFVQGFSNNKKFIATQGPKAETIVDFWRMIYLYKVKAIVMLTNLTENGVLKCHQYWPCVINKTVAYGSNQVTLVEELICGDYVKRRFDLITSNTGRGEKPVFNTVTHYYYQKWYDRGVPDTYPISILKLIRDVNENHPCPDYPIVVHCSAGVGRTGTYITLDAMLENLNTSESFIDIYDFVSKLRMQRCYLVQTLVQYIFIHDSLNDFCIFGFTDVKKGKLKEAYKQLKKKVMTGERKYSEEIDQLRIEFDKLNIQKSLTTSIKTALENSELNRDPDNLCFDENRVILRGIGSEKNNYINATNTLNNLIITDDPMENTILNFWKMIIEYKTKLIVSLNKEFMQDYEKIGWPTPENPCIIFDLDNETKYEIKLLQSDSNSDNDDPEGNKEDSMILIRYFKITNLSSDIQTIELNVTNLIFNSAWWEDTSPQKTDIALDLIKRMNYFVEMLKDSNILIHGHGGGSNCLMVCALYVLIDQLTFENSVDIFNVVKYLNTQRWNTKINYDQYDYLYKCLAELPEN